MLRDFALFLFFLWPVVQMFFFREWSQKSVLYVEQEGSTWKPAVRLRYTGWIVLYYVVCVLGSTWGNVGVMWQAYCGGGPRICKSL